VVLPLPPLVLPVGPLTPYVTPEILTGAPTGISWNSIPPGKAATPAQRLAEQSNICLRATAMADAYCNQVLRATVDTEQDSGPDKWVTVQSGTQNARVMLQRWPVLAIQSVSVAPTGLFPRQFTTLPAGYYDIERPILGISGTTAPAPDGQGGQAILLAPGYVSWALGRNGFTIRTTYINGWPHTSLTTAATAGTTTLPVDDCTGWAISTNIVGGGTEVVPVTGSTTGIMYDSGGQEVIQVTAASVNAGAGTLTLQNPLQFSHNPGVMVSTLPASLIWATILFSTAMALTRGATATTVHEIPGAGAGSVPSREPSDLIGEAELLLNPYRRTI
jgi:hypothetical protein